MPGMGMCARRGAGAGGRRVIGGRLADRAFGAGHQSAGLRGTRVIALDQATSIILTVFFIFLCVNAINLMDGLDGLAAGVVGIGASAMFAYTYVLAREQNFVVATTASLITVTITGICLGFLPHNFNRLPSSSQKKATFLYLEAIHTIRCEIYAKKTEALR